MSNNWDAPSELPNKLYIGGKWVAPSSGEYEPTVDPATGKEFASIALGNEADVLHAIENSKSALKEFRKVLPAERGRILTRAAAIIRRDKDLLARVETLDSG